mmetsp:Transcript_123063/g.359269  ORF Transcript_123063/g.359269 Transcript_123063/m.359269 type:complete len:734 (+) Transcript_123063:1604-3805(+)
MRVGDQDVHDQPSEHLAHVCVVHAADELRQDDVPHPRLHGLGLAVYLRQGVLLVQVQLAAVPGQLQDAVEDEVQALVAPVQGLEVAPEGEGHKVPEVEGADRGAALVAPEGAGGPRGGRRAPAQQLLLEQLVQVGGVVEPGGLVLLHALPGLLELRLGHLGDEQLRGGLRGPARPQQPGLGVLEGELLHVLQRVVPGAPGVEQPAPLQLRPHQELRRHLLEADGRVLHHDGDLVLPAEADERQLHVLRAVHKLHVRQGHLERAEYELPRWERWSRCLRARQKVLGQSAPLPALRLQAARQPGDVGQDVELQKVLVGARVRLSRRRGQSSSHLQRRLVQHRPQAAHISVVEGQQALSKLDLEGLGPLADARHVQRLLQPVPARELPRGLHGGGLQPRLHALLLHALDQPQGGLEAPHVLGAPDESAQEVLPLPALAARGARQRQGRELLLVARLHVLPTPGLLQLQRARPRGRRPDPERSQDTVGLVEVAVDRLQEEAVLLAVDSRVVEGVHAVALELLDDGVFKELQRPGVRTATDRSRHNLAVCDRLSHLLNSLQLLVLCRGIAGARDRGLVKLQLLTSVDDVIDEGEDCLCRCMLGGLQETGKGERKTAEVYERRGRGEEVVHDVVHQEERQCVVPVHSGQAGLEESPRLSLHKRHGLCHDPFEAGGVAQELSGLDQLVRALQVRAQGLTDILLQVPQDLVGLAGFLQIFEYLLHCESVGVLAREIGNEEL